MNIFLATYLPIQIFSLITWTFLMFDVKPLKYSGNIFISNLKEGGLKFLIFVVLFSLIVSEGITQIILWIR